jgi:hypothetical protein
VTDQAVISTYLEVIIDVVNGIVEIFVAVVRDAVAVFICETFEFTCQAIEAVRAVTSQLMVMVVVGAVVTVLLLTTPSVVGTE